MIYHRSRGSWLDSPSVTVHGPHVLPSVTPGFTSRLSGVTPITSGKWALNTPRKLRPKVRLAVCIPLVDVYEDHIATQEKKGALPCCRPLARRDFKYSIFPLDQHVLGWLKHRSGVTSSGGRHATPSSRSGSDQGWSTGGLNLSIDRLAHGR